MSSVFERNPKKTLLLIILTFVAIADFSLAHLAPRMDSRIRTPNQNYHHDFVPLTQESSQWGEEPYFITTNSLGFKDQTTREVPLTSDKYRILFMGDSFTEGIGYPYEKTFVGLIDQRLQPYAEVLNAGVSSYSPKLYFSKLKYLIDEKKLSFDEVALFIDISDIQDEIVYAGFNNRVYYGDMLEKFALDNSIFARLFERKGGFRWLRSALGLNPDLPGYIDPANFQRNYNSERGRWTYDASVYDAKWGAKGVELALKNMEELYSLLSQHHIKLSITVYPWPEQISQGDINSRQVQIWQEFCRIHDLKFTNLFPAFFKLAPSSAEIIPKYFIKGDNHWNAYGHAIVAQQWLNSRCAKLDATCFRK